MAWQGNGMGAAWTRHAMCESAFIMLLLPIEHRVLNFVRLHRGVLYCIPHCNNCIGEHHAFSAQSAQL